MWGRTVGGVGGATTWTKSERGDRGQQGAPRSWQHVHTHTLPLWVGSLATAHSVSVPSSKEGEREVWSPRLLVWERGSRAKAKLERIDKIGQRWKSERKFCPRRRGPRVVFSSWTHTIGEKNERKKKSWEISLVREMPSDHGEVRVLELSQGLPGIESCF